MRVMVLTLLAMVAFAGNSLLARLALKTTAIDAASFTTVRLLSGALCLWLIVQLLVRQRRGRGNWRSSVALFVYAAAFSFAYLELPAGTGALLLFGAVQVTMVGYGFTRGDRFAPRQVAGFVCAFGGLIGLLLPGITAPPLAGSLLMIASGIAWGGYSLRGSGGGDPTRVTAGNFLRTVPLALAMSLALSPWRSLDGAGIGYAIASGALTSGVGYAIWYTALTGLRATSAATVQLSVPVIAALGGIVLLGEPLSWRLVAASVAILGGIALVILGRQRAA